MTEHLTLATWHYEIGADDLNRHSALRVAVEHISECSPDVPDLVAWTAADWLVREPDQLAMRWLAAHLGDACGGIYEPFPTPAVGRRGATILLANRRTVRVNRWYPCLGSRRDWGWLGATLWGTVPAYITAQHWTGDCDNDFWSLHGGVYRRSDEAAILLGQLSQTSSWAGEVRCDFTRETEGNAEVRAAFGSITGTGQWKARTMHVDQLRANGFVDAGEQARVGVPTREVAPRIRPDRIMFSHRLQARVVPGTYRAHPSRDSDPPATHRLVTVQLAQEGPAPHGRTGTPPAAGSA